MTDSLFDEYDDEQRTAALNAIDQEVDADNQVIADRLHRLAEHNPQVAALRAMGERVAAAKAAEAAAAAARPPLPPPLTECQRDQQVQHRTRGWIGTATTVTKDGWAFVRIPSQVATRSSCSAWFRLDDLCEPQDTHGV